MDDPRVDPSPEEQNEETRRRIPLPREWSDVIDQLIEDAMRQGAFDNLPGHGKPLRLFKNPYAPGTELAYQLLKDNNYTLPWIAQRNEVIEKIDLFRAEIRRIWRRYQDEYRASESELIQMALSAGWRQQLSEWERQTKLLNELIADVNLKQPAEMLEIVKLALDSELVRAGASRELF
jgi:hypothetical protein